MEYVKSRLTWRVPVDEQLAMAVLQSSSALAELGGRQVTVDLNGADLLGAVDDVWVDTRTDGGQTLVFELDVHTAVRMDGAGELVMLAMPADGPPPLEWDCMVCGRTRPDAAIAVTHRRLAVMPDAFPEMRVNVRHCNDDPSCIGLAAAAPRWGAAPVVSGPPELESTFDGPCPFLTCTAMEPHAHPVCRSCGAVRYGNLSCPTCYEERPAMEQREAARGWFPAHAGNPAHDDDPVDVKAHLLAPHPHGHGQFIVRRDPAAAERVHTSMHHDHDPADVRAHLAEPAPRGHGSSTPVPLAADDAEDFHTGIHHGLDLLDAAAVDAAVEAALGGQQC